MVFGPWYFGIGPWYLVRSVDPKYCVQGIGSKWFWTMILKEGYLYKENVIRPRRGCGGNECLRKGGDRACLLWVCDAWIDLNQFDGSEGISNYL